MQRADELKTFTCVCCPKGCLLEVSFDDKGEIIDVSGYSCATGKAYAVEEATDPRRMLSSVVYAKGCLEPLSVKTSSAVPKALIADVAQAIRELQISAPVKQGDVLIEDVCGTGISVLATKSLEPCA